MPLREERKKKEESKSEKEGKREKEAIHELRREGAVGGAKCQERAGDGTEAMIGCN